MAPQPMMANPKSFAFMAFSFVYAVTHGHRILGMGQFYDPDLLQHLLQPDGQGLTVNQPGIHIFIQLMGAHVKGGAVHLLTEFLPLQLLRAIRGRNAVGFGQRLQHQLRQGRIGKALPLDLRRCGAQSAPVAADFNVVAAVSSKGSLFANTLLHSEFNDTVFVLQLTDLLLIDNVLLQYGHLKTFNPFTGLIPLP